jgi:hypothetical protein
LTGCDYVGGGCLFFHLMPLDTSKKHQSTEGGAA